MHLVLVHPRLEARGRPFSRSPGFRSRVNLRVLRPLTRGPHGQPSPLRTPHGRPGAQGIFPTSRGQAPHGWPMVHDSMAAGFPVPRGCCLALFVALFSLLYFVRNLALSRSPFPHLVSDPLPESCGFPIPRGRCAALAASLSWPRPLIPSLIPCLYTTGPPATQWRGPPNVGPFCDPGTGRSYLVPFCRAHVAFS